MLFANRPETPINETLSYLTDVLEKKDGSEQRICLRVAPRTKYHFDVLAADGVERQRVENLLFGGMAGTFLVPAWPECGFLSAAAGVGDTELSVDTDLSLFRPGGRVLLVAPDETTELVETITVGTDSVSFSSGLARAWPAGSEVYPVRSCVHPTDIKSQRWGSNLTKYTFDFQCLDDDTTRYAGSLAWSTLGFGDDSDLVVVDDGNAMADTIAEAWTRPIQVVDGNTGAIQTVSYNPRSRRSSAKGWVCTTRSKLLDVRRLLDYLQGRQRTFLLPTFAGDCTPAGGLTSGGFTLDVANAGFSTYNGLTYSRKYLRIYLAGGSTITRQVSGVAVVSSAVERITVTTAWASDVSADSITRVTILEKVRVDSDDVTITHSDLVGSAKVAVATRSVLE